MPETEGAQQVKLTAEDKWAVYNAKMAALFAERDKYPLESPERDAAVERVMALWVAEG